MTFEELLLALEEHSNLISNETKIGHNTNVRVGMLGKKVAEILRKQGDTGEKFLSKINDDTAQGIITFLKAIVIGDFSPGLFGSGGAIKNINGTIVAEFDQLLIRQRAEFLSVLIHQAKHIGGELVQSAAEMICIKVEETTDFYRCYFDADDGKVVNLFENTDFARHQVFTGSKQKFYWRKIVAVGPDYIELSKTDAAINSDIPEVGDYIYQLGSENTERQGAIILSTVGPDAPSIKQYVNINTYALSSENEYTVFSRMGNKIQGKTVFRSNGLNYDDWADGTSQDIQDAQAAANAAALTAQQAIDDAAANVADYNQKFADIQAQVDGEISNYSYPYKPTLANYPASDWTTDIEKDRHIGDIFHNSQAYVDNETTPDAGKAWRFVNNGTVYSWNPIADSDAVKAIQEASKAQAMADGKSTTYLLKPDTPKADGYCYHFGDMWVLNSDITLNGTAYKQGEILTATQDSTTFNEAHWLKRVRYTDDTAVDNLQIGGRNLFAASLTHRTAITNTKEFTEVHYGSLIFNNSRVLEMFSPSTQYTIQYEVEIISKPTGISATQAHGGFRLYNPVNYATTILAGISHSQYENSSVGDVFKLKRTFTTPSDLTDFTLVGYTAWVASVSQSATMTFRKLQIEKGTKATDWSPAPEDVEASIETAKTEAENAAQAYADTKAEAERVLAEAYADGKVSAEEQARIDDVNAKLAAAKAYAEAQDALLKTQQEAYADGVASAAELAAIGVAEAKANLARTEAEAYADGKVSEEEERAIADAKSKLNEAKNHADTIVNDLESGLKNLITNPINASTNYWTQVSKYEWTNKRTANAQSVFYISRYCKVGERYTFSFEVKVTNEAIQFSNSTLYINSSRAVSHNRPTLVVGEYVKVYGTFVFAAGSGNLHIYLNGLTGAGQLFIRNFMLGRGNKAIPWSPAVEDVQEDLNKAQNEAENAQLQADGYMRARYVRDWLKGNTDHNTNNWSEIKVVNKAGVNLALGLPANNISSNGTWHASYPKTNVIDGNTGTQGHISQSTPTLNYVQIDLGQVHYDIDYIGVWHAGWPTRLYFGTKTEISEDGVNWTTIFDSAVEGTYAETAEGKIHSMRYANVLAKLNQTKAITDKFATEINGGLITTVMMLLREVNSQITTAGFSGIQGALLDQPSYWSGGTHIQAQAFVPFVKKLENEQSTTLAEYNNLPSIVFLHNGAAKIGQFIVLTTGEILIIDKNSGAIKLKFSTSDLPAIADLIAGTNSSGSTPIGAGVASNSSSQVVSGSTQITKNGATATFNGTYISISATGKVQTNGIESFAEAVLYARKDGVRLHRLATSIVDFHSEVYEEKYNEWPPIPRSFITDAGKYTFELVVHTEGLVSSATAITSSTNLSWKHVVAGVKQQQYAKDGMMFFYSNRHFYFNELTGLDVKESDSSKFNMPGVLAAGSSTPGGFQSNVWGAKSSTANMTPITGGFRVPLSSLSHSNYVVQITPHTNTTFRVGTKTSTYFEVYGTGGFDYVVIGNNYA